MSAAVDVLAAMDASASVLRSHMRRCNNKANHDQPHLEALVKQDRAAYLLAAHADARAAVAELIKATERLERKAVEQSRTTSSVFTSDVEALRAALVRVGGAS